MQNDNGKPSKEDIAKFNDMYQEVVEARQQVQRELNDLKKRAKRIDKMADKAFQYAVDPDTSMYYETSDGKMKCVSKSILNKIDNLADFRGYSYNIFHQPNALTCH